MIPALLLLAIPAPAVGRATPDEAKAMAINAAANLKAVGPEKAFPEFDAKDSYGDDCDRYVAVRDLEGTIVARATTAGPVSRTVLNFKDIDGKSFNQPARAVKDTCWISYEWWNPAIYPARGEEHVHRRCRRLRQMSGPGYAPRE